LGPVGLFFINTPLFLLPRRLRLQPQHRVLDVGCGRASALRFLTARMRFQAPPVGVDIAPSILEQAAADLGRDRSVELVAAAATRLPFAEESFDLVLSAHVVKHLNDDALRRLLAESWRVLRPGGVLVVWEFAPTRSILLNRFHHWALTRHVKACRFRGYGDFVDIAVESPFADMEILELRPFLFPPIPRTGFLLRKGRSAIVSG
jgi:ubiquinone/menaquinone biosynthesis C-methylase UbiE